MPGKFITLILAASLAVTGLSAAPARASDRDLALALGALVGVAVIGAAIHDANKKDRRRAAAQQYSRPNYGAHRPHRAQKHQRSHAYQQGYNDHRPKAHHHRSERRDHRRDRRPQYGYSARPYNYAK